VSAELAATGSAPSLSWALMQTWSRRGRIITLPLCTDLRMAHLLRHLLMKEGAID
jgi:hypothetical protein